MIFDEMYDKIKNASNIAIFSHMNSDGDAIGSSIAMKLMLEKLNKNVSIFIQKPIHHNYNILGVNNHIDIEKQKKFDLAIALDSPNVKRFGIYQKKFEAIKESISFDHHKDNENFATYSFVDVDSSSTCFILYNFFKYLNLKLDAEIAKCLYVGMATDTGRFLYANLDNRLFEAVADLYKYNFDYLKINYNLFQRQSKNEFNLYKTALNIMDFYENDKIAICRLDEKIFVNTKTSPNDTFKIIDAMLQIDDVKIFVLMSQSEKNEYLVSIRSKDDYDSQKIASQFGGGGHTKASGCRLFVDGDTAYEQLLNACKKELNRKKK